MLKMNIPFWSSWLAWICCGLITSTTVCQQATGNWPQWRGPNRDNISKETGLDDRWPTAGPRLVWQLKGIGHGMAPVVVAGGKIFTVGAIDGQQYVEAIDPKTGKGIWATQIGEYANFEQKNNVLKFMRWLTQRCPTIDGQRLYYLGDQGDLVCLSCDDGKELWRKNYAEAFQSERPFWGYCDYPLIDGEQLICTPVGKQGSVVALDKKTGKQLWQCSVDKAIRFGYAATIKTTGLGEKQYIVYLGTTLVGIRATDGKLLWEFRGQRSPAGNWHTPLMIDQFIFVPNGYGGHFNLIELKLVDQAFTVEAIYKRRGPRQIQMFHDNSVRLGDHVYLISKRKLTRFNWKTGESVGEALQLDAGRSVSYVYADGKLFCRSSEGELILVQVSPEKLLQVGRFRIPDSQPTKGATTPVVADGHMYVRDDDRLFCYDVRKPPKNKKLAASAAGKALEFDRRLLVSNPDRSGKASGKSGDLDAPYVPTPEDVVVEMLKVASVTRKDIVYDLGSGDGRIIIAAAKKYGCKAVGIEIDKRLVELSRKHAKAEGVEKLVTIIHGDMFKQDISEATVVTTFLYPSLMKRLLPKLNKLEHESRVVSHQFEFPDHKPDKTVSFTSADDGKHKIHLWKTPIGGKRKR